MRKAQTLLTSSRLEQRIAPPGRARKNERRKSEEPPVVVKSTGAAPHEHTDDNVLDWLVLRELQHLEFAGAQRIAALKPFCFLSSVQVEAPSHGHLATSCGVAWLVV